MRAFSVSVQINGSSSFPVTFAIFQITFPFTQAWNFFLRFFNVFFSFRDLYHTAITVFTNGRRNGTSNCFFLLSNWSDNLFKLMKKEIVSNYITFHWTGKFHQDLVLLWKFQDTTYVTRKCHSRIYNYVSL